MTLIIGSTSKSTIVSSSDSRFAYDNGVIDDENGSKNFKITSSDADILVAFCGNAMIDNDPEYEIPDKPYTMLWLGDFISRQDAHNKYAREIIENIREKLENLFENVPVQRMSPLILSFSCRPKNRRKLPYIKTISNIDPSLAIYYNPKQASIKFQTHDILRRRNGVSLYIDGFIPATNSTEFTTKLKELNINLNRRNTSGYEPIIRDLQIELIRISAKDPKSNGFINERVVGTFLDSGGLMHVKHVPDDGLRRLPGFQNNTMTTAGLSVSGDIPGGDADYLVGETKE